MKLDPCLTPLTKIYLKWIQKLNVRSKIMKLPEESLGKKLLNVGLGNDFLDMTPKTELQNKKQVGLQKAKNFLHSKRNKVKR